MSLRRSTRVASQKVTQQPTQIIGTRLTSTSAASTSKRKAHETATSGVPSKKTKNEVRLVESGDVSPFKKPPVPSTPAKRQRAKDVAPPLTPTPSMVHVIRAPYSTGDVDDGTPPPRPANPHVTNAVLVTPGGTQAVAWPSDSNVSPTKQSANGGITTASLLSQAQHHLVSVDSRFGPLIAKHHCEIFSAEGLAEKIDPFRSLTSGICGQQVSGAAAKAIKNRFVALYNVDNDGVHVWPTPASVAETSIEQLRTAGLSQRKAEYIQGLAEKFVSGELSTQGLLRASDEEIMEKLIAVRGLGKWSVEMFACFGLKRMDILSTGDLGVQRGMAAWFGRDVSKLKAKGGGKWKYMSEQEMLEKSKPYAPYRSLFMWFMWRVADLDTAVLDS